MKRLLLLVLLLLPFAARSHGPDLDVAFEPHPGARVPGSAVYRETSGEKVALQSFLGSSPVVLVLGYLDCNNLCSTITDGVDQALRRTGVDYVPLFVSIDPRDEKAGFAPRHAGWHVLTGAAAASELASAVGFVYRRDQASGEYAHPAGFVVLTPEGKVSRYFTGVRFEPEELREALRAARAGDTPGLLERVLLVCFHDPANGRYSARILEYLRIAMLLFAAGFGWMIWRRRR